METLDQVDSVRNRERKGDYGVSNFVFGFLIVE